MSSHGSLRFSRAAREGNLRSVLVYLICNCAVAKANHNPESRSGGIVSAS